MWFKVFMKYKFLMLVLVFVGDKSNGVKEFDMVRELVLDVCGVVVLNMGYWLLDENLVFLIC